MEATWEQISGPTVAGQIEEVEEASAYRTTEELAGSEFPDSEGLVEPIATQEFVNKYDGEYSSPFVAPTQESSQESTVERLSGQDAGMEEAWLISPQPESDPMGPGRHATLTAVAERIASLGNRLSMDEFSGFEGERHGATRWTRCFGNADIGRVRQTFVDNAAAAAAESGSRCSCIVMLNVALGELLRLPKRPSRARGGSKRTVQMAALTTQSIDKAMAQLIGLGYARAATVIDFVDQHGRTAGTLAPVRLKASVANAVLRASRAEGCWFAFGLSIMDGYHSVLLLVDKRSGPGIIYWQDQFSTDVTDDVTKTLDDRITKKTQAWWGNLRSAEPSIGSVTKARIWQLGHRVHSGPPH